MKRRSDVVLSVTVTRDSYDHSKVKRMRSCYHCRLNAPGERATLLKGGTHSKPSAKLPLSCYLCTKHGSIKYLSVLLGRFDQSVQLGRFEI